VKTDDFCPQPVSEADAEGLGTTICPPIIMHDAGTESQVESQVMTQVDTAPKGARPFRYTNGASAMLTCSAPVR
jgi:hypothetical protein